MAKLNVYVPQSEGSEEPTKVEIAFDERNTPKIAMGDTEVWVSVTSCDGTREWTFEIQDDEYGK